VSISRKLLTIAAGGALAATSLVVSSPASARPAHVLRPAHTPESLTTLTSGPMHVITSTGKHLILSIQATRFAQNPGGSNAHRPSTLEISLRGNGGHENHAWSFKLAANSFADNAAGNGILKTAGQIAPYGRLSLIISPLSNLTTQVCDNANLNRIHRVALKGTFTFLTHSSGPNSWGKLAHRSIEFTHGKLSAGHGQDVEEACATIPCQAGVSWTASQGSVDLNGFAVAPKGKKPVSRLEADRSTTLSTPAQAVRFDTVIVKAPPPSLVTGGVVILTATSAGGIATGSGKLASNHHSAYHQDCSTGQMVGTEWNATYDALVPPLTFHEQIFGPLSIAVDKSATFMKVHIT
jgi:hypothetical protein